MITQIIKKITQIKIFITVLALTAPLLAVEIEPLRLELEATSGQAISTLIKVTNWFDYPINVKVKPDTYRHIFTEGTIEPGQGEKELPSCKGWIALEPAEFKLSSKSSILIKCVIDVPQHSRGEYVASILFDEEHLTSTYLERLNKPGNITLEIVPRFTIPLYVIMKENKNMAAEISQIKVTEGPNIGTIAAEITLHNKGNIHIRPKGNLIFMDSSEKIVKTLPIGECLPIFPDFKEKISVYYPKLLEPGIYSAVATIDIGSGRLIQKKTNFRVSDDYDIE